MVLCPECGARIPHIAELELWDHIFCEICGAELEVVGLNPLEVDVVYDLAENDEVLSELDDLLDEDPLGLAD